MSIAAEKLPLPHRDIRKKSYRAAAAMNLKKPEGEGVFTNKL
jgi:hypothetical protein